MTGDDMPDATNPKEFTDKIESLLRECDHSWRDDLTPKQLIRKQANQVSGLIGSLDTEGK